MRFMLKSVRSCFPQSTQIPCRTVLTAVTHLKGYSCCAACRGCGAGLALFPVGHGRICGGCLVDGGERICQHADHSRYVPAVLVLSGQIQFLGLLRRVRVRS